MRALARLPAKVLRSIAGKASEVADSFALVDVLVGGECRCFRSAAEKSICVSVLDDWGRRTEEQIRGARDEWGVERQLEPDSAERRLLTLLFRNSKVREAYRLFTQCVVNAATDERSCETDERSCRISGSAGC